MKANDNTNEESEAALGYRPLKPLGKHGKGSAFKQAKISSGQSATEYVSCGQAGDGGGAGGRFAMPSTHRPPRSRKLLVICGVIVALLLVAYLSIAVYFTCHFMPNTKIGASDVSLMSATDAEGAVSSVVGSYQFVLEGQGLELTLKGSNLTFSQSSADVAREAMAAANPWAWPLEIARQHDETEKLSLAFSDMKVKDAVRAAVDAHNTSATGPINANIAFDAATGTYVVTPEKVGAKLEADVVAEAALKAVSSLSASMTVGEDFLKQPTVVSSDARLVSAVESANAMAAANFALMMGKDAAAKVDSSLISQWIKLGDDFSVTFDEGLLSTWANNLAKECSTVGTARTYTRADGKEFNVSGGVYGWEVKADELVAQVKEGVSAGRVDALEIPCGAKGDAYSGAGKRDWGNRYVDVDLTEQHARFYDESGAIIWEADFVSGIADSEYATPTGVYWANRKASPSTLKGYQGDTNTYNTEVQYWMPFEGDAVGFHDAEWQSAFGGTRYRDGFGSHGCINLEPAKAQELYGLLQEADTVVCHM